MAHPAEPALTIYIKNSLSIIKSFLSLFIHTSLCSFNPSLVILQPIVNECASQCSDPARFTNRLTSTLVCSCLNHLHHFAIENQ